MTVNKVKLTMARIKFVLWERRIQWLQAQEILKSVQGQDSDIPIKDIKQVGRRRKRVIVNRQRKAKDKRATSWTIV
jgi:hypothetical protein